MGETEARQVEMQSADAVSIPAAAPHFNWGVAAAGFGIVMLIAVAAASLTFGSPTLALRYLRGERLLVGQPAVHFGRVPDGAVASRPVRIVNWTDTPVRLLGAGTRCPCLSVSELPATVAAGKERIVRVTLDTNRRRPGGLDEVVILNTDSDHSRRLYI